MKGNNDPQQALNLALHQLAIDFGELTKDLNKRIALAAVAMAEAGSSCFTPSEQAFHGTYDDSCADAIEAEYTDVTPTNFPQLTAPKED
jgi:hypothetical protein